jgi:hypothetical protein
MLGRTMPLPGIRRNQEPAMNRLALILLLPLAAAPSLASPLSDCYDKLIAACTGDWGDATYRACVKGAMNHCDSQHAKRGLGFTGKPGKPRQFGISVPLPPPSFIPPR